MYKLIFLFSILLILLLLTSVKENFVLPKVHYEWGLHENNHRLRKIPEKVIIKEKDYPRYEREPEYEKVYRGKYKCYYEPGEDIECKRIMKKCSIKSHPDFDKYILKSKIPSQPDMTKYILKSRIPGAPDMSNYIHKDDLPDMTNFISKDELKNYTKNDQIPPCERCPPIPKCPTCPKCPEPQIIQKTKYNFNEHPDFDKYMLKSDCHKTSFGELIPNFLRKEASSLSEKIQQRRNRYDLKC